MPRAPFVVAAVAVLGSGVAHAKPKPLPAGMKVIAKLGRPYVQQGATTVALRDDDLADYEKIETSALSADAKSVVVTATRCNGTLIDDDTTIPLAKIQARFDNAAGQTALTKKKYGDAIAKFAAATQKDPDTVVYASNQLVAQTLAKKLDLAAQTLAIHGAKNPVWFVWQLATDPQLAPLKDSKRAKALAAATPGTATIAALGERDLATTDASGGIAALRTSSTGPGSPGTSEIDFVSLTTGKLMTRFPIIALEDACDETEQSPCSDEAKARIDGRRKLADQLFATLGFTIQSRAFIDVRNGDPVTRDGVSIELADDGITVTTTSGAEKKLPTDASAWAIAITPKALVIKLNQRHLYRCDDQNARFIGAALPL